VTTNSDLIQGTKIYKLILSNKTYANVIGTPQKTLVWYILVMLHLLMLIFCYNY